MTIRETNQYPPAQLPSIEDAISELESLVTLPPEGIDESSSDKPVASRSLVTQAKEIALEYSESLRSLDVAPALEELHLYLLLKE